MHSIQENRFNACLSKWFYPLHCQTRHCMPRTCPPCFSRPRTDVHPFPGYVFSTESNTAGHPRNRTHGLPSQLLSPPLQWAFTPLGLASAFLISSLFLYGASATLEHDVLPFPHPFNFPAATELPVPRPCVQHETHSKESCRCNLTSTH